MRDKHPLPNSISELSSHLGLEFYPGRVYGSNCGSATSVLYAPIGRHCIGTEEGLPLTPKSVRGVWEGTCTYREKLEQACTMSAVFFVSGIVSRLMEYDPPNEYLMRKGLGVVNAKLWTCSAEDASHFMAKWLNVPSYSLRAPSGESLSGSCLVIPLGKHPNACGIQLIDGQGRKAFLKGSVINGKCWYAHDESVYRGAPRIGIGGGVATVLSINRVYGWPVVAAMNSRNLEAVAECIKRQYQAAEIIIISDKDESGTRQRCAEAAALAVGGRVVEPTWTDAEEARYPMLREMKISDFNDYFLATQRIVSLLSLVEGQERAMNRRKSLEGWSKSGKNNESASKVACLG